MNTNKSKQQQIKPKKTKNEKEDAHMAVLAQNVRMSFELDSKKAKDFFNKSDKTAFARAIERASSHKSDKEKSGSVKCISTDEK